MTTSGVSPQFCRGVLSPLNGTPQSHSGKEAWDGLTREMTLGKFSQRTCSVPPGMLCVFGGPLRAEARSRVGEQSLIPILF